MSKARVCVFASSSNFLDEIYYEEIGELGCLLAKANFDVVYGGSNLGLMWTCAKAAKLEGACVYGVMPEKLYNILGPESSEVCDELHVTENMRTRKAKLDEISDAVVAVAGGFGTLEELSEMIVQKQLGYNSKPIIILNTNNFYDKLIEFFEHMIKEHFANANCRELYYVAKTPEEVVKYLLDYKAKERVIDKDSIYKR